MNRGSTSCFECVVGRYQDQQQQDDVECKVRQIFCWFGLIFSFDSYPFLFLIFIFFKECIVGKFQNLVKRPSCKICPSGWFQPNELQVDCLQCPTGYQQSAAQQISCIGCEPGTFQDNMRKIISIQANNFQFFFSNPFFFFLL